MILLIYLICFISVFFYILFSSEKVKNKNLEQSKKETEELKTEWVNFLKEDTERYYPNKYKKFWE